MRLIDKFTIWFILITTTVLIAGGLIVFNRVQYEIDNEAIRRIKSHIDDIAKQLRNGQEPSALISETVTIDEISRDAKTIELRVYDTMAVYRPWMQALDRKLTVQSSYIIGDKHYRISMYDFVAEPDEISDALKSAIIWIFIILLVIVVVTNLLISRRILSPFHQTLKAIEGFSLKSDQDMHLPATRTREFEQLNFFLGKMTRKARADYRSLKEFTENASHELQTPLAVIRGKLELLLETSIDEQQGNQIFSALSAIERVSKISNSLLLLNKLENQEFVTSEKIDFSSRVRNILSELSELMEMKSLNLKHHIQSNVKVTIHPSLADILITNLLSNAIRHNVEKGSIHVTLTNSKFEVVNSGLHPEIAPDKIFSRFSRSSNNPDSIGLGLAIVKQICEVNSLRIDYEYEKETHKFSVTFSV